MDRTDIGQQQEIDVGLSQCIHDRDHTFIQPENITARGNKGSTDQFPTDLYLTTKVMLIVLKYGGLQPGGLNFDAKVRRESFEPIDLFHAHIGGMDTFARGLKVAAAIRAEGTLDQQISHRYRSWETGIGQAIEQGNHSFESLEKYTLEKGEVDDTDSGRQEAFENLVNRYIL